MATTSFHSLLEESEPLASRFRAEGRSLYLVGGIVRDSLLGHLGPELDFDFTTDALPDEIEDLIRSANPVALWTQGKKFGTIGAHFSRRGVVRSYEVTTHRGDTYTGSSRKPQVAFGSSLEEDLARRDFTINAMAVDVLTGTLIDPFRGQEDLAAKQLRTPMAPEISFSDDPLRMLRAGRFIARFGLTPTQNLVDAALKLRFRLGVVSPERIRSEFDKLLVLPGPEQGLRFLIASGLSSEFLPELAVGDSVGRAMNEVGLPLQEDFVRLIRVLAACPPQETIRISGLFSTVIEPDWPFSEPDLEPRTLGLARAKKAEARMTELRYSTNEISSVKALVVNLPSVLKGPSHWTASDARHVLRNVGPQLDQFVQLADAMASAVQIDDPRAMASVRGFDTTVQELRGAEEIERFTPDLDGDDVMRILGIERGKIVGDALSFLLDLRLNEGTLGRQVATERLIAWAESRSISVAVSLVVPRSAAQSITRPEDEASKFDQSVREVGSQPQGGS